MLEDEIQNPRLVLSEAMFWIKEVEIFHAVDDLKSSRSMQVFFISRTLRCRMRGLLVL